MEGDLWILEMTIAAWRASLTVLEAIQPTGKLGGCMRLGVAGRTFVIVTGLWMLVGSGYFYQDEVKARQTRLANRTELCAEGKGVFIDYRYIENPTEADRTQCTMRVMDSKELNTTPTAILPGALSMTATIAAIVWVLGFLALAAGRWIMAGRKAV